MLARDVDVPITRILVWTGHDGLYDQQADLVPFLVARQVSRILPRAPLTVVLPLSRVTMANIGVTLCEGDNERSRFVGKAKSLDFADRLFSLFSLRFIGRAPFQGGLERRGIHLYCNG